MQSNGSHIDFVAESQTITTAMENTAETKCVASRSTNSVDTLLVRYLESLGYQVIPSKALSNAPEDATQQESNSLAAESNKTEHTIPNGAVQRSLMEYATTVGLKAHEIMFNHLVSLSYSFDLLSATQ